MGELDLMADTQWQRTVYPDPTARHGAAQGNFADQRPKFKRHRITLYVSSSSSTLVVLAAATAAVVVALSVKLMTFVAGNQLTKWTVIASCVIT